jgi:hypothetical protein
MSNFNPPMLQLSPVRNLKGMFSHLFCHVVFMCCAV